MKVKTKTPAQKKPRPEESAVGKKTQCPLQTEKLEKWVREKRNVKKKNVDSNEVPNRERADLGRPSGSKTAEKDGNAEKKQGHKKGGRKTPNGTSKKTRKR